MFCFSKAFFTTSYGFSTPPISSTTISIESSFNTSLTLSVSFTLTPLSLDKLFTTPSTGVISTPARAVIISLLSSNLLK